MYTVLLYKRGDSSCEGYQKINSLEHFGRIGRVDTDCKNGYDGGETFFRPVFCNLCVWVGSRLCGSPTNHSGEFEVEGLLRPLNNRTCKEVTIIRRGNTLL